MIRFVTLVSMVMVILSAGQVLGGPSEAEKEMQGVWVPRNNKSCKSDIKIEIHDKYLILHNKKDKEIFGDFDLCYSCAGGNHYSGIEIWLTPNINNDNKASFILRFNADEEKGILKIDLFNKSIEDKQIAKRFPIHKYDFKKCK